jgi:hypothetical protein
MRLLVGAASHDQESGVEDAIIITIVQHHIERRLARGDQGERSAAIRMRSGGRDASWSRRTRTDASPL